MSSPHHRTRANKTDAGNGSYGICRVIDASRSPSPDPNRSPNFSVTHQMEPIVYEVFGSTDPKRMPAHFFCGSKFIDYGTAIRADISKQTYTVAPRHWYIDCDFDCAECHREFTWTAREQQAWFEQYGLWVDAQPRICKDCKAAELRLEDLRREYDSLVAAARDQGTVAQKLRIISIITDLQASLSSLPQKMLDTLHLFEHQTRNDR
jgi:hypothetical protein